MFNIFYFFLNLLHLVTLICYEFQLAITIGDFSSFHTGFNTGKTIQGGNDHPYFGAIKIDISNLPGDLIDLFN